MGVWSDAGPRGHPQQVGRPVSMQRRPGDTVQGQGVGVLQRERRASWPKCHPEQLRLHANGGSQEGLTGRGSAGFREFHQQPRHPEGRYP